MIHTSRLLDSFLAAVLAHHKIPYGTTPGMGAYLKALTTHQRSSIGQLPDPERIRHQSQVVSVRNGFMHQAGAFPTRKVADDLLSSMQACMADVAKLE